MTLPARVSDTPEESGLLRSARLMRALGAASSSVWNELDPQEAVILTRAMDALPPEDTHEAEAVSSDFLRAARYAAPSRPAVSKDVWERLSALDPSVLAGLIANEHPQTVSLIFSKLNSDAAARLSQSLPTPLAMDALRRLLHMKAPHSGALVSLERALGTAIANLAQSRPQQGHERVARIFDKLDSRSEQKFLAALENAEPGAGERVRALMFTFDDLARLDAGGLQTLLSAVDRDLLVLALKGAHPEIEQAFFANLTQRAGDVLRDEIRALGPVRRSGVEAARNEIVDLARALMHRGDIVVVDSNLEELVE